jgi:hypothetical protein
MQDPYIIMTRGFKNVVERGSIKGYEFNIRIPYYRGTFLSLVDSLSATVDGQSVPTDRLTILLAGREFTLAQAAEADDVRWGFGDPATLRVTKPGGLTPGSHMVQVGIVVRKSYFPPEDPEHLYSFFDLWVDGKYRPYIEGPTVVSRKMTLVQ